MSTYYWYTLGNPTGIKPGWRVPPWKPHNEIQTITETIFEGVRKKEFPSRPPRLGGVFVCPGYPSGFCDPKDKRKTIFEVDVLGKTFGADSDFYSGAASYAPHIRFRIGDIEQIKEEMRDLARSYWRGQGVVDEIIVAGTVSIVGPASKKICKYPRKDYPDERGSISPHGDSIGLQ